MAGAGSSRRWWSWYTLNQLRVQGGFAASRAAWRWVTGLYARGILDLAPLVTHRFDLEAVDAAFAALTAPDTDAVKILVQPGRTRAMG